MDKLALCNSALLRCGAEPILVAELTTPTSKRGTHVVNQYELTLKELLNDSPWNFATKRVKISLQKKAIVSWAFVGTTITLTVASGHGFVANDVISVAGLSCDTYPANIDGVAITSVTATTIIYTFTDTPTGTPTVVAATAYVSASCLFNLPYRYALPSDYIRLLELEDKTEYRVESTGIMCDIDTYIRIKYVYYNVDVTTFSGAFAKAFYLKLAEDISYVLVQSADLQGKIAAEAERYLRKARSMNSQEGTPESRIDSTLGVRI